MIQHIACIMDGNRRWAKLHNLAPWLGHQEGLKTAERVIKFCLDRSISIISLYAFSLENLNRPEQELQFLFGTIVEQLQDKLIDQWLEQGVEVRFSGDRAQFPEKVVPIIKSIEQKKPKERKLLVNILFCYGGQQELVNAMRSIAKKLGTGALIPGDITAQTIEDHLWTAGLPQPDLVIRTGGAKRLSNFLLFQVAYSELYFLDCLWPDITEEHLDSALEFYYSCKRNFGR